MAEGLRGRIFNVQRFSLQDGPGLRTTAFLKGCPLACTWCHNPESQAPEPELVTVESRCIRCGACRELCPSPEACVRCEACAGACPTGARQVVGRDVTPEELAAELLRDRLFFDQSGGGVTFSGGEPLMQAPFLAACLARLKAEGVHLALDTCGFARREELLEAAALSDLVLFDLKLVDGHRHADATGERSEPILENLEALGRAHDNIWIRVPVVPGLNDDAANLEATARIAARTPGVRRVDLLPYHAAGAPKAARVGQAYALGDVVPPSLQRMEGLAEGFRRHGIAVTIGGRT